jgi:CRP-like cAMP-binding protein
MVFRSIIFASTAWPQTRKSTPAYPKGAVLVMEGQAACGIFAVCSGQVKLSTSSLEGKAIILKIAEALN